jgi:LacI family transcriptional regulator
MAVRKVARQLNYQPNHLAAALRNGKSKIIGIIVPNVDRTFFSAAVKGIEEVANQSGYNVMICQSHDDHDKEVGTVEALINARVDGIIASHGMYPKNLDHFLKAKESGIPLIMFDRSSDELGVSQVVIDDVKGAYLATEHLIQQGCKRIAHFTGNLDVNIFAQRYQGYREALSDYKIKFDERLVIRSFLQLDDGVESMRKLLKLENPPDAVFSASAFSIMGALLVLRENKLKVPEDVALVTFSDEPFTWFSDPTISTVDQHSTEMGKSAAELFFNQLENGSKKFKPQKTVIQTKLIVRQSSLKKK